MQRSSWDDPLCSCELPSPDLFYLRLLTPYFVTSSFFPIAGSPHCTKESCAFRDAITQSPVFNDLNAIVIGVSQDTEERARRFVDEHKLGFRILSDRQRQAMIEWGVGTTLFGLLNRKCLHASCFSPLSLADLRSCCVITWFGSLTCVSQSAYRPMHVCDRSSGHCARHVRRHFQLERT